MMEHIEDRLEACIAGTGRLHAADREQMQDRTEKYDKYDIYDKAWRRETDQCKDLRSSVKSRVLPYGAGNTERDRYTEDKNLGNQSDQHRVAHWRAYYFYNRSVMLIRKAEIALENTIQFAVIERIQSEPSQIKDKLVVRIRTVHPLIL